MAAKKRKKQDGQSIIKNMGLFWKRQHVRWKGNAGIGPARLAGCRAFAKRQGAVDFWTQTGIYALYADYQLVYVGQAGLTDKSCLGNRLKQHLNDLGGRWNMFSWFGLQAVRRTDNRVGKRGHVSVTSRGHLANVLEGIIIEVAEPPLNSQKGRFGKKVERYIQVDDSIDPQAKADEKLEAAITDLGTRLSKTKKQLLKAIQKQSVKT